MASDSEASGKWRLRGSNSFHTSYVLECSESDRVALIYAGQSFEWSIWGSPKPEGVPHDERGVELTLARAKIAARQVLELKLS